MQYIYSHGFGSSPASTKAVYFAQKFADSGHKLIVPDLNLGDFQSMTLTKQVDFMHGLIADRPTTLIGSSLGGLLSVILAEQLHNVAKVVLLAPALAIHDLWPKLVGEHLHTWQTTGQLPVYHYAYNSEVPLNYEFLQDLMKFQDRQFIRQIATLIFHGQHDEVVPYQVSQDYVQHNHLAELEVLPSDHGLEDVLDQMWGKIHKFIFPD